MNFYISMDKGYTSVVIAVLIYRILFIVNKPPKYSAKDILPVIVNYNYKLEIHIYPLLTVNMQFRLGHYVNTLVRTMYISEVLKISYN